MGRSENLEGMSGDFRNKPVGQKQFLEYVLGALKMEFPMMHRMIPHFMRTASDEPGQLGMPSDLIADQKKRGGDLVDVQYLENPFRSAGAGPIIKGEIEVTRPKGTP
jgi:hypothetical protein